MGITTIADLLLHLPRGYEDLSAVRAIDNLKAGETQVIQGEVVEIDGHRLPDGRAVISIVINDGSRGSLEGAWFNQPSISSQFRYGQRVSFTGKPKWYRDHWQMTNPRWQALDGDAADAAPGIVPIYPMTENLRPESLRRLIRTAVDQFAPQTVDIVPQRLLGQRHFPGLHAAFRHVHLPTTLEQAKIARRRFTYEEFLVLQSALALRRRDLRDQQSAPPMTCTPQIDARIRRLLPFTLTADQDQAIREICFDLASPRPMQRLLQADVGAGKTCRCRLRPAGDRRQQAPGRFDGPDRSPGPSTRPHSGWLPRQQPRPPGFADGLDERLPSAARFCRISPTATWIWSSARRPWPRKTSALRSWAWSSSTSSTSSASTSVPACAAAATIPITWS